MLLHDVDRLGWLHPDVGHLGEEDLGLRLFENALFLVKSTTFKEESIYVGSIGGLDVLVQLGFFDALVVPTDQVNGDGVLPREVLLQTRQETLREEEA